MKKEKDHLDVESKMSEEMKLWKKNLEEKLNETKKQLEAEMENRFTYSSLF